MIQFRLFGIPITILPWFWITLVLIGSGTLHSMSDLFPVLLFVLAGFFSILVHELGHGLTIKKFGANTQIVLQAFGGIATYPLNTFTRRQDFLITAAGPGIQLLLGAGVYLILGNTTLEQSMGRYFLVVLMQISFFWAIFNLMPVYPLDGGQLLNAILGPKRKSFTHVISIVAALLLGVLAFTGGVYLGAIFMAFFAYQNFQFLQAKRQG